MPKVVCCQCSASYEIVKTGAYVIEMFSDPPQPYKLWSCDAWECPGCGHVIAAGFPHHPLAEHFQPEFKEALRQALAPDNVTIFDYERGVSLDEVEETRRALSQSLKEE